MRKKWNSHNFVIWATEIHGDTYDYSKSIVTISKSMVTIICKKHGAFKQRASAHVDMKQGCRKCADEATSVGNSDTLEMFIKKSVKVHGDKYDYSLVDYRGYGKFVTIVCPIHGEFKQRAGGHTSGKGCKKCSDHDRGVRQRLDTEKFISNSINMHGTTYGYSKSVYTKTHENVIITCSKHGDFLQLPSNHVRGWGCPKCSNIKSSGELEIVSWLRSLGIKVISGSRKIIPPKEIDIFLPEYDVAIEYNGLYWHSEYSGKDAKYHENKLNACADKGTHLMQFWDFEWKYKKDIVKSIILNKIGMPAIKLYARKLTISSVETKVARAFCEKHHLHGFRGGCAYIALVGSKRIVSLFIVAMDGELVRYVVAKNTIVVGGFSRLLAHSTVKYSFVDRRVFNGHSYFSNGFKLDHITKPNYFYAAGGVYLGSRNMFKKELLSSKLPIFDSSLSEVKNMANNGYSRVFDCGNLKLQRIT